MIPKELTNNYFFKRLVKYCSTSIKSQSEVTKKLKDLKASSEESEIIVKALLNLKFCFSDEDYVTRFLENLSSVKGYSKLQIKTKLLRKGIPPKEIDSKLNSYFKENEQNEVLKYIQKNFSKLVRKPKEKRLNYLISKGFSVDISRKLLKETDL